MSFSIQKSMFTILAIVGLLFGMPAEAGKPIYNKPEAEKAWAKLVALYKAALG